MNTALDLRNVLDVAEAITLSAIERKESRGGHFREDYPDKRSSRKERVVGRFYDPVTRLLRMFK